MHTEFFLPLGIFILAYGLISRRLDGTPITAPILAVLFGAFCGPAGLEFFDVEMDGEQVQLLAEIALAMVLFHDAARIDLRLLRRNARLPFRLLGPGLLMTVGLGFLIGLPLLPELGPWEVALLAALLAPTDAALGQAVVTQETVPMRVRQALNVESGLNDGLIVPIFAVLLACAAGEEAESAWTWVEHALIAVGWGVGAGVGVGLIAAKLLDTAEAAGWMHAGARRVAVGVVPIIAFFAAEELHGSGFLAAFLAGIALGSTTKHLERHLYDYTEDTSELLGLLTWVVFGVAVAGIAPEFASLNVIAYALLSLTVIRMVPVALALIGTHCTTPTVVFLGWFGPRGLASVVFGITVYGREDIDGAQMVFGVAVWTVLLSVFLHGMTASWLARRYGERVEEDGGIKVPSFPMPRSPQ